MRHVRPAAGRRCAASSPAPGSPLCIASRSAPRPYPHARSPRRHVRPAAGRDAVPLTPQLLCPQRTCSAITPSGTPPPSPSSTRLASVAGLAPAPGAAPSVVAPAPRHSRRNVLMAARTCSMDSHAMVASSSASATYASHCRRSRSSSPSVNSPRAASSPLSNRSSSLSSRISPFSRFMIALGSTCGAGVRPIFQVPPRGNVVCLAASARDTDRQVGTRARWTFAFETELLQHSHLALGRWPVASR